MSCTSRVKPLACGATLKTAAPGVDTPGCTTFIGQVATGIYAVGTRRRSVQRVRLAILVREPEGGLARAGGLLLVKGVFEVHGHEVALQRLPQVLDAPEELHLRDGDR